MVLKLFSPDKSKALNLFIEFMKDQNADDCLDDKAIMRWSDQEVSDYLHRIGITDISRLQQMSKNDRNFVLTTLKDMDGITVRQLSRITGISRSVIDRIH